MQGISDFLYKIHDKAYKKQAPASQSRACFDPRRDPSTYSLLLENIAVTTPQCGLLPVQLLVEVTFDRPFRRFLKFRSD